MTGTHTPAIVIAIVILVSTALAGCAGSTPSTSQPTARDTRVSLQLATVAGPALDAAQRATSARLQVSLIELERELRGAAGVLADDPESSATAVAAASQGLDSAREAYRRLDFEGALARLHTAQDRLVAVARSPAHFAVLGQIALHRGLNLLALDQRPAAAQALRLALVLGQVPATPGQFAPEVEALLAALRADEQPTGGLSFVRPAGARIWIDGRDRGLVPVSVQLDPGLHHVRATLVGHGSHAQLQPVAAGIVDRIALTLQPADRATTAAQLLAELPLLGGTAGEPVAAEDLARHATALRRVLGVDALLRSDAGALQLLWLQGEQPRSVRCAGPGTDRCVADGLYRLATRRAPPSSDRVPASRPFYRRWWFWTVVAGAATAAAAAGTTAYLAGQPRRTDVDIRSRP